MKTIFQIALFLLGFGGGGFGLKFMGDRKIAKLEKTYKKEINSRAQTIDSLKRDIQFFILKDSLKQRQIEQIQSTILVIQKRYWQIRIDSTKQAKSIIALEAWKADAQDGVVTDTVNIEYKTNIFGKRKRIK